MRLAKIKIRGLRSIANYERDLMDKWFGEISPAVLVMGANGAGKTTLLETAASLWSEFGQIPAGLAVPKRVKTGMFKDCRLAAVQLRGILSPVEPPTWLFAGGREGLEELRPELAGCQYWGLVRDDAEKWCVVSHDPAWQAEVWNGRTSNVVHVTSDERSMQKQRDEANSLPRAMGWHAVYRPGDPGVSEMMFRLSAEDPEKFQAVLDEINSLLCGKKIVGFSDDRELLVRTDSGDAHDVYGLSTGERQIVILVAFTSRWLRDNSVLLVDEPDLHLHISATQAMVHALRSIAEDCGAQIIFTSNSAEVWQDFARRAQRIELENAGPGRTKNYNP